MKLAQATESSVVAYPPFFLRKVIYNPDLNNLAGHGPWDASPFNPIVRYGQ